MENDSIDAISEQNQKHSSNDSKENSKLKGNLKLDENILPQEPNLSFEANKGDLLLYKGKEFIRLLFKDKILIALACIFVLLCILSVIPN